MSAGMIALLVSIVGFFGILFYIIYALKKA
ncbi:hypothetical protein HEBU111660_07270 [Helicobacter burdigaliensis]